MSESEDAVAQAFLGSFGLEREKPNGGKAEHDRTI